MCRYQHAELPPTAAAAAAARTSSRELLAAWGLAGLSDTVQLLVSELVTNAALHARTTIGFTLGLGDGVVEVGVADHDPRPPSPRPPAAASEPELLTGGRGIFLVDELSDEWGVSERRDGKQVWFRIAVPRGWQPDPPCPCPRANELGQLLGSGMRVVAAS